MGYIQVEKIIDCLVDPLSHCLRDQDPYVRKTAAICVAKLYMYDRALVENERFIEKLRDLLNDPNPTVRAAARLVGIVKFGMLLICFFRLLRTLLLHLRKYLSVQKISNWVWAFRLQASLLQLWMNAQSMSITDQNSHILLLTNSTLLFQMGSDVYTGGAPLLRPPRKWQCRDTGGTHNSSTAACQFGCCFDLCKSDCLSYELYGEGRGYK